MWTEPQRLGAPRSALGGSSAWLVPDAFAGKGVGSALAKAALGYAREHGRKVKPICPFIAGYINKHPEWQDLVHADFRERLGLRD